MFRVRHFFKRNSKSDIKEGGKLVSCRYFSERARVGMRGTFGYRPTTSKDIRALPEGGRVSLMSSS